MDKQLKRTLKKLNNYKIRLLFELECDPDLNVSNALRKLNKVDKLINKLNGE